MWKILLSVVLSFGAIFGAQTVAPQTFGASQPISALTAKTSLAGTDLFVIVDNASTPTTKKITVANATSTFKTYNDTLYSPLFTNSAGLASLLSDETGSSGGFVRAGSPTIDSVILSTSANITAPTFDVAGTDATGDIWYRNSGGLFTRLAAGNTNDYLRISGGLPAWTATSTIFPSQTGKSGSFLATDGTNISWGGAAAVADYFSTTTTGTWTKPSLVNASSTVFVECWGGGGGGGGSLGGGTHRAGGGGGGAYLSRTFKASDLTSTVSVTIGVGGTGGAAGGANNGIAGGNTTFGSYLTAYGGGGGGYANGAGNEGSGGGGGGATGGGTTGNSGVAERIGGGPGAITTGSQDGFAGGFGSAYNGATVGDSGYGGGGGGHAVAGGASVYGGGGGGGGNGNSGGTSVFGGNGGTGGNASNGSNGSVPGGGGGGEGNAGGGSNFAGGNGAGGKCNVVTYN